MDRFWLIAMILLMIAAALMLWLFESKIRMGAAHCAWSVSAARLALGSTVT